VSAAKQLDVEVLLHQLESHFLAGVGNRQIGLAEAASAEAAPNRVPLDRLGTGTPAEQARFIPSLVERIDYDGAAGQVAVTFHVPGIQMSRGPAACRR
jgi:hypothetical protein